MLCQAQERQEPSVTAPRQRIADGEELDEYQGRKRKEFEGRIRYSRESIRDWIKYAVWEASQNQFERYVIQRAGMLFPRANRDRARSVFERALDVDPRSNELWVSSLNSCRLETN
jgi:crooked neck